MSVIKVPQLNKTLIADPSKSLMQNLLDHQIPVASSCGGDGICGKCIMKVNSKNLPPPQHLEMKTLQKNASPEGHRLSCQIKTSRDITAKTTYW